MNVGLGYAVPINVAQDVITALRDGPPSWGSAGLNGIISTLNTDTAEMFGVPPGHAAVIVTKNPEGGPSAGKLHTRDVIFRLNSQAVYSTSQVQRLISNHAPGDQVYFDIIRDGVSQLVHVVLEEGWSVQDTQTADYFDGYLGLELEDWVGEDGERGNFDKPVITKVYSLGPAHQAQITSSQRTLRSNGPFIYAYQLDVKTITGIVYQGQYQPVANIEEVEEIARVAYEAAKPLLLEIELWSRVVNMDGELQHAGTGFFRVSPQTSIAPTPSRPYRSQPVAYL